MTKRRITFGLVLMQLLLCAALPAIAADREPMPEVLYTGIAQTNLWIRTEQSREATSVGHYTSGSKIQIIGYEPEWLEVAKGTDRDWVRGYVLRHQVADIKSTDAAAMPYGTTPAIYTAVMGKATALRDAPDTAGEPLMTLTEGTRVAILGIEDGWARVIFFRQYGYFYVDAAKELTRVYDAATAKPGDTIGAFMSFFSLSTEGLNPNRIVNIKQACEYIVEKTLAPGEEFDYDGIAGPYQQKRGYLEAMSFYEGEAVPSHGGGSCQVSSTLYNVLLALSDGMSVTYRVPHGPSGAKYLPHGVDAACGGERQNLIFSNTYNFSVRIETQVQDGALFISMVRVD